MPQSGLRGLSEEEAAARLAADGPNALPSGRGRSLRRILAEALREPMLLLLIVAAALYLLLGDLGEGLFMVAGAAAAAGLVVVQEARSERALAALRTLAEPSARVLRGGTERRVPARELVCGDIVLVGEGDRLPADGRLIAGDVLSVDEAALTGESAPVAKKPAMSEGAAAEGDEEPSALFAGTLVVRGQGVMRVTATGARSALGRIGAALAAIVEEPTGLQRAAGRIVRLLGAAAFVFCGLIVLAYGLLRLDWSGGALAGVTVAVSLIPEEFPSVLAIFLALGAARLARSRVLVRRSAAIETLGAATVLCVDKTGTLTENRMSVARLWTPDREVGADAAADEAPDLVRAALLASAVRPLDPMDLAIRALSATVAVDPPPGDGPERTWPLRPELLAVVQLWREADGGSLIAAKGAPEAVFRLCRLDAGDLARVHQVLDRYARDGLRVLGVAAAAGDGGDRDPLDMEFRFLGLIAFADPLRAEAAPALAEALAAGVKVIMITGDHPATALAIARSVGIDAEPGALLGSEIDAMTRETLQARLAKVRVFARIRPEQKLRIVEALKAAGETVAMTGDGVNDAPALQAADIGVAMGRKGADVAREAADIVLLDDSFAAIVAGVRLGRRIFANLRRALTYVAAVHLPIAGLALTPVLLGIPPMLLPAHIVLLELVIDPTCALVFEAEPGRPDAMRRPPRPRSEGLFGRPELTLAMAQGGALLAAALGVYLWALGRAAPEAARAAAFLTLIAGNLVLALAESAVAGSLFARHRRVFWFIALAVGAALAAALLVPPAGRLFAFARPGGTELAVAAAAALAGGGWIRLLPSRLRRIERS
jgi:Ca2+-transporting ATPase